MEFIGSTEFFHMYNQILSEADIDENIKNELVNEDLISKYVKITNTLIDNNKKFNLTAIKEPKDIIIKHIIDSVLPFLLLEKKGKIDLSSAKNICDVGTGAGFPLLPLGAVLMARNAKTVLTGIDSTEKKLKHIQESAEQAGLGNIKTASGRAEEISRTHFREKFDIVTARAVAPMGILMELTIPLTKVNGCFIALKGQREKETEDIAVAARILGAELADVIDYSIPGGDTRTVYLFNKTERTPGIYPRRYTEIKKKPVV